jgi:hypothetical protein
MEKSASCSDKSSKKENECSWSETDRPTNIEGADISNNSTDVPNIEGTGISSDSNSNSCKVDLTVVSDSQLQNTAKFLAVSDHNKDESEMGEMSDSDVNTGIHHTVSKATALSTGSTAEAIPLLTMNSTALESDDGSVSPSSRAAVISAVGINSPCSVQIENSRNSEAYDGHIDLLCTSSDRTQNKNLNSSDSQSSSVTRLPVKSMF